MEIINEDTTIEKSKVVDKTSKIQPKTRFQLFNPAHATQLLKLFHGAHKVNLDLSELEDKTESEDEDSSEAENDPQRTTKNSRKVPRRLVSSPMTFYQNNEGNILVLYKTALFVQLNRKAEVQPELVVDIDFTKVINSPAKWGVVMISGGHFAAAVFQGGKAIHHKTIHKYTVRAKQGGAQSTRDNKAGTAGHASAGGSLRRHNEASLVSNIHEVLESWKSDLDACQWIFYRVGNSSQQVLFGGKTPIFEKNSSRLKTIPFPTKRPTFNEVKRVVLQLTTVQVYTKEEFLTQFAPASPESSPKREKPVVQIDRARSRSPKVREDPGKPLSSDSEEGEASDSEVDCNLVAVDTEIDFSVLQEFGDSLTRGDRRKRPPKKDKKPKKVEPEEITPHGIVSEILNAILSKEQLRVTEVESKLTQEYSLAAESEPQNSEAFIRDLNQFVDSQNSTILHIAVKNDALDLVWSLLECGADPIFKDKQGKYPYNWSGTKECRMLFRKFRGKFPDKYDYQKAQVPDPITESLEQELAEKKRIQNKLKREKERQKKQEKKEKQDELDEKERFLNMSDREKRALAAEKRIVGEAQRTGEAKPILLRCFDCGVDMTGKVPFEYNKNQFCTSKCLTSHRKKFPTALSC